MTNAAMASVLSVLRVPRVSAADDALDTTTVRIAKNPSICIAPQYVAEEFLRANAEEAVTIEAVADAAGCSVRALQLAFRRFRNITPMEALRRIRLERAQEEIARGDSSQSVIEIAAKFGFTNPGRFSEQYKRAFGELPSDALRRRAFHS